MPKVTCGACKDAFFIEADADVAVCPKCLSTFNIRSKAPQPAATPPSAAAAKSAPPDRAPPVAKAVSQSPAAQPSQATDDPFALQPGGEIKPRSVPEGMAPPPVEGAQPHYVAPPSPAEKSASPKKHAAKAKSSTVRTILEQQDSDGAVAQSPNESSAPPASVAGIVMAGAGGVFLVIAIVLFCIGPLRSPAVSAAELREKRDALQKELDSVKLLRQQADQNRTKTLANIAAESQTGVELAEQNKRLDQSFETLAAANARNAVQFGNQQANVEKTRKANQELLHNLGGGDPTHWIPMREKAVAVIFTDIGSGSGFVLNDMGMVATNYHVIEGSSSISAKLQKESSREHVKLDDVKVIAVDPERDLALLQLPACPVEISNNGKYPCVTIRTNAPAQTGENVVVIGNPGLENIILDYTVTRGIVSNAQRTVEKHAFIQISAVVNPGNSGGPVFDNSGSVMGVVVAKGVNVEAVTFVIPAADLRSLIDRKNDVSFAVNDSLEEWEKTHRPMVILERKRRAMAGKPAVELSALPTAILPSQDGKLLYLLFGLTGKIQEFDIKKKALGRECRAECILAGITQYTPDSLLTNSVETHRTLRVNTRTMSLDGEIKTLTPVIRAVNWGGAANYALLMQDGGRPYVINQANFAKNTPVAEWPLGSAQSICFAAGSNSRWLILASVAAPTVHLEAYPALQIQSDVGQLIRGNSPQEGALHTKIDALKKTFDVSLLVLAQEGRPSRRLLTWSSPDEFIFARRMFKVGVKLECEGDFELSQYAALQLDEKGQDETSVLENILTVSPDGKYAASGYCVYDVATRKIIKELPVPSGVHAFSNDGKGMALIGPKGLYYFDDWQTSYPNPVKGTHPGK